VERTDGVPLFVEEYTRAVIDSRAIERTDDDLALSNKLSEPLVPSSIHDSLMERLDRLGPAKRVAQIASVFGRQFTYDGILNVLPGKGELLKHALQALESAGIVYRIEEPQATLFTFKHAMIQDAAYSSLLKEKGANSMRGSHRGCFRKPPLEKVASRPYSAITMRVLATFRKRSRPGFRRVNPRSADRPTKEAVAHLREGLSLIPKLPASPQRYEAEIALQIQHWRWRTLPTRDGPIRTSTDPIVAHSNFARAMAPFARR